MKYGNKQLTLLRAIASKPGKKSIYYAGKLGEHHKCVSSNLHELKKKGFITMAKGYKYSVTEQGRELLNEKVSGVVAEQIAPTGSVEVLEENLMSAIREIVEYKAELEHGRFVDKIVQLQQELAKRDAELEQLKKPKRALSWLR